MKALTRRLGGWVAAAYVLILRYTCRKHLHNDPRAELRAQGHTYLYAVLHAHQIGPTVIGEKGTGAMVSRSGDGDVLVPALRVGGIVPIRGSSIRKGRDRGGMKALEQMVEHVKSGHAAYLAVDGPRGPRNRIGKGIAHLSRETGAPVIPLVAIPSRRWLLTKVWDRMQIPKPFCTIDLYFADPLWPHPDEKLETFRLRIQTVLNDLERVHDPEEAPPPEPEDVSSSGL